MRYLSTVLPLLGILNVSGPALEHSLIPTESASGSGAATLILENVLNVYLIFSLTGFSGLCILCGVVLFAHKRSCNDHYHLERRYRELIEAVHHAPGNQW